jgi:flagellar basal body-associated protein FliL
MKCVPVTQPKTSLETRASRKKVIVIAATVSVGLILVAVAIYVVIILARKRGWAGTRGMFQHPASRYEMPEWVCDMVIVE